MCQENATHLSLFVAENTKTLSMVHKDETESDGLHRLTKTKQGWKSHQDETTKDRQIVSASLTSSNQFNSPLLILFKSWIKKLQRQIQLCGENWSELLTQRLGSGRTQVIF